VHPFFRYWYLNLVVLVLKKYKYVCLGAGITNMALAHEIAVDKDFTLQKLT
jgi:hypothetical protein